MIGHGRLLYFYSHGESRYGEVTHWELGNENIVRKQVTRFPEVWSFKKCVGHQNDLFLFFIFGL